MDYTVTTEANAPLFAQQMGRAVTLLQEERRKRQARLVGHNALTQLTRAQQRTQLEVYALAEAITILGQLETQANASKGPAIA